MIERERRLPPGRIDLFNRITADPTLATAPVLARGDRCIPLNLDPGLRHDWLGMLEPPGPHSAPDRGKKKLYFPERLAVHSWRRCGDAAQGGRPENPSTEMPEGVEGELLVRGYSLMDGLYKRERAETFDEDGWYRTGDKGYFRDSYLFFTGRSTEMIKTGGANVAPREVELALESLSGVQAAFVVGLPDAQRESVGGLSRLSGAGNGDRSN